MLNTLYILYQYSVIDCKGKKDIMKEMFNNNDALNTFDLW